MSTVAVLVNPTAGKGRGARMAPVLARHLHARGVEAALLVGTDADEALRLARAAVADGVDALVACGGDGTVHLALQAVAGTSTPLGIVPVGTGDDIADALGVPDDVEAAAAAVAAGHARTVDAATVECADGTRRWFLGVICSGFDSAVNERTNRMRWPTGRARYVVATLAELRTFRPLRYAVELDGQARTGTGMLVAVGNGTSYGGGMKVCPGALVDDGRLDVTWLHEVSVPTLLRVFPRVYRGTHVDHPQVSTHRARTVRLDAPGQVVYADGERIGPLPALVEVHPGAVRVLVPPPPAGGATA